MCALVGCSDASIDATFQKIIRPRLSPQQYLLVAVSDADPDVRRDAVAQVAESDDYQTKWAIDGFVAIATLETDAQARCVAVRALGRTDDRRAVETFLKILNHEDHPPQEIRPPGNLCRWDATQALAAISERGAVPDELGAQARDTLLDRLANDSEAQVRCAAAEGLASYSERDVVSALIGGLNDENFAVAHACEMSLVQLTGETHDCSQYAWQQWYDAHKSAPFANAGHIPESRRAPYDGKVDEAAYKTKQFFRWVFPAAK
jgi:hypothetical protein